MLTEVLRLECWMQFKKIIVSFIVHICFGKYSISLIGKKIGRLVDR